MVGMQTDDTIGLTTLVFSQREDEKLAEVAFKAKPKEVLGEMKPLMFNGAARIFVFVDGSFANNRDLTSQLGFAIILGRILVFRGEVRRKEVPRPSKSRALHPVRFIEVLHNHGQVQVGRHEQAVIAEEVLPKSSHKFFRKLASSVRKFLDKKIGEKQLKTATDQLETRLDHHDSIAVPGLTLKQVESSLLLDFDSHDVEMEHVEPCDLPPYLDLIEQAFGRSPSTEAKTRWLIDAFILHAYAAVTSDLTNAQPLNVQCERGYSFGPVKLNGKRVIFSGRMDYSIWYGETELLCLNVLVVEAKGGPKSGHALPQLLGYMGMYLAICVFWDT
ncbi:uncharacterized protein N7515_003757 [Penicillium bovifimosum]|uniref:Uncharacterized protein n=1 Tax=Penicillium bovifimosum TaxID=126998 RepID=A0A9W9H5B8_9EURO|nr:uncharacterized protein N7515_003757 [Penicillium bovifimosum]KAJ5138909.1 hypothetical protein N7515_003757 [Penicillium bovifimosum]